jgi:hypothetical protein
MDFPTFAFSQTGQLVPLYGTEAKDREMVQRRLREHVRDGDRLPLLIFPEARGCTS